MIEYINKQQTQQKCKKINIRAMQNLCKKIVKYPNICCCYLDNFSRGKTLSITPIKKSFRNDIQVTLFHCCFKF